MSTLPALERELQLAAARLAASPSWHRRRRTWLLTLAGTIVLAGGAAASATHISGGSLVGLGKPTAPQADPPAPRALGTRQRQLDALRQPLRPETTLPQPLQANIREVTVSGENPRLGRKAVTAPWGDTFWVVPAAHGKVCLLVNGGGGGCGPAAQIDTGTFSGVAPCHAGGAVYDGLLPNGAADVALTLRDGTQRRLTVTNNVWAFQIALDRPQPTTISWTSPRGVRRHAPIGGLPPPGPGGSTTCAPPP